MKELCPDCEILYSNADQDAAKQQQQAEAAITEGANVLVLDPVDVDVGRGDREAAPSSADVPVISYDRLIPDADIDYYVSFDNGGRQAAGREPRRRSSRTTASQRADRDDQRRARPTTTPSCSRRARTGLRHERLQGRPRSTTRPTGAPTRPSSEMEQAITALGKDGFVGRLRGQRRHRRRRDRRA